MIYKASILPLIISRSFITIFNKLIFKFIWCSNWKGVSRKLLCNKIESSGVKMIHLDLYLTALLAKSPLNCFY